MASFPGRARVLSAPVGAARTPVDGARVWADARRAFDARPPRPRATLSGVDADAQRQIVLGFVRDRIRLCEILGQQAKGIAARENRGARALGGAGALGGNTKWFDPAIRVKLGIHAGLLNGTWGAPIFGTKVYPAAVNAASNGTATAVQIIAWGDTTPPALYLTDVEIDALLNAEGWVQGSCPLADPNATCVFKIWDQRYAKWSAGQYAGQWTNRNDFGTQLGTALAPSSDPSHTIVGNITSGISDAVNSIGKLLGEAAKTLWAILQELGEDAVAVVELLEWMLGFVPELIDPKSFIKDINPLQPGTRAHNLVNDPSKTNVVNVVAIVLFAPFALGLIVLGAALSTVGVRVGPASVFTPGADGANIFTRLLRDLANAINASTAADKVKRTLQAFEDFLSIFTGGIQISPPALLQVAILLLTNIPLPPVGSIIETLIADPMVQRSLSSGGVPPQLADQFLPVAARCFQSNSAQEYLACAQGILELFFPGFISKMQNTFFVSLSDLRVVVAAMWASNGDLSLLLDNDKFPGVHEALVGIGVLGFAHVITTVGGDVGSALSALKGILPGDLLQILVNGEQFMVHVVSTSDALASRRSGLHGGLDGLGADAPSLSDVAKRAVWHLQKSRWDVQRAVMAMRLDEYETDVWAAASGGDNITRIKDVALFRLIRQNPDDPTSPPIPEAVGLLSFLVNTFGAPLAHFLSDLLGGQGQVPAAIAASKKLGTQSGKDAAAAVPRGDKNTVLGNMIPKGGGPGNSSAKGAVAAGATAAVKTASKAAIFTGGITAGAAGFFIGGPPGAAVGFILGALLGSKPN